VEGGVTNPVQVAWARDCFAAIVERAQAVYNKTNEVDAITALIADLPGGTGITTNIFTTHTNEVLVFQTDVLRELKILAKELAPYFAHPDIDPADADAWWQAQATYTTNALVYEVDDACGEFEITGDDVDYSAWTALGSVSNLLVQARRPQNYFDVWPYRWQSGVCETNLVEYHLFWTNAQTAAGGPVPDDWPLVAWTIPDYGWDGLRDTLRNMQVTTAGVGSIGQDVVWRPAGPDALTYGALVDVPFQNNCGGDFVAASWAAAITVAEANITTNTPSASSSAAPSMIMVGASNCDCWEAGATVYQAIPVLTNRTMTAQAAGLDGEVFWYALRTDADDFANTYSLDSFGSQELTAGDAFTGYAPLPSEYDDIAAWPAAPSNDFAIFDSSDEPHRGAKKAATWGDPFALIRWAFEYQ
jgi:hypothetical protein